MSLKKDMNNILKILELMKNKMWIINIHSLCSFCGKDNKKELFLCPQCNNILIDEDIIEDANFILKNLSSNWKIIRYLITHGWDVQGKCNCDEEENFVEFRSKVFCTKCFHDLEFSDLNNLLRNIRVELNMIPLDYNHYTEMP